VNYDTLVSQAGQEVMASGPHWAAYPYLACIALIYITLLCCLGSLVYQAGKKNGTCK
jgi:hypothetical protein